MKIEKEKKISKTSSNIDTRSSTVNPWHTQQARRTRWARLLLDTNTLLQIVILLCSLCLRFRKLLLRVLDRIHALRAERSERPEP